MFWLTQDGARHNGVKPRSLASPACTQSMASAFFHYIHFFIYYIIISTYLLFKPHSHRKKQSLRFFVILKQKKLLTDCFANGSLTLYANSLLKINTLSVLDQQTFATTFYTWYY